MAAHLAQGLSMLHDRGELRPDRITPGKRGSDYVVSLGSAELLRFDQNDFTPPTRACRSGNLRNHASTLVRISDRGPRVRGRMLDLSRAAAEAIGPFPSGVGKVRITVFKPEP